MVKLDGPLIDDKNPLYCPAIPASAYLKHLRSKIQKRARSPNQGSKLSNSFARVLEQCSHGYESDYGENNSDWALGHYLASGQQWLSSQASHQEHPPPYSPTGPAKRSDIQHDSSGPGRHIVIPIDTAHGSSLKRKNTFSDIIAPPKYARSIQSVHDSSFDIEVRREQLLFSGVESSPLCPAPISSASPEKKAGFLIDKLNLAFPGIRLEERMSNIQLFSAQSLMDFLSHNGYINQKTLEIFSDSDVERITFAPSMFDENGLNLGGHEIYSIFAKQGCFQFLSEISFAGIHIRDSDIRHIHHLPRLSILLLDETGITNEAVFLLVSLKSTLTRLSLATNPDINNDAVPAVILLSRLSFLSIIDTCIDMLGLRRLAEIMLRDSRNMDIEIPFACEAYVQNIRSLYLYMPLPPLIIDPDACNQLSSAALQRNLEAHAICNPSIVATGTRAEMEQRLYEILRTRKLDALVMSMLEGN